MCIRDRLYKSKCQASGNEVVTSYNLDRKEKIYSEKEYLEFLV